MTLSARHREWFEAAGIDPDFAERVGCFTAEKQTDIPEDWRGGLGHATPGIILPWTSPDGFVSPQLHPDTASPDKDGRPRKYVFQKAARPVLWALRPEGRKILIVEGSKQGMAAALYAPLEYAVYAIAGCSAFSKDQRPIPDLEIADGKDVVVCFDADAGRNLRVWEAGARLQDALKGEGAKSVSWLRIPAWGTNGLDDLLRDRKADRRLDYLANLLKSNVHTKISDKRPSPRPHNAAAPETKDRPHVAVDGDPHLVIKAILARLQTAYDRSVLFNHGNQLAERIDSSMVPVDGGGFNGLVQRCMQTIVSTGDGQLIHRWPETQVMSAVLSASQREFSPLHRLTNVPFVRPDGTICDTPGYDKATQTFLLEVLDGVSVPEHPTPDQVASSVKLLLSEWLGDMPFPDQASRANMLALLLTPIARALFDVVPLAILDGLQMGVGKNLLADCVSMLVTGNPIDPKPYSKDDDENKKMLTGCFRAGAELICLDEAHEIQGAHLARILTSAVITDRLLGGNVVVSYPNTMTWMALGNGVRVTGDMQRRAYWVSLLPTGRNPQDRGDECFRHPDLKGWTRTHRAELLNACLTIVRGWYVAGKPTVRATMGSFEGWQRQVGGMLAFAGVPGFLENLQEKRSESDYTTRHWADHFVWLQETFGDDHFTSAEVTSKARLASAINAYEGPPALEDPTDKSYPRKLGLAYERVKNPRVIGDLTLVLLGTAHRKVNKWAIRPTEDPEPGAREGGEDTPPPTRIENSLPTHDTRIEGGGSDDRLPSLHSPEVVFDLETCSADELYSRNRSEFVRLAGSTADGEHVTIYDGTDGWEHLLEELETAGRVIGHNIMGFDLIALARSNKLDLRRLVMEGRVYDTLLAARYNDPPMAKEKRYDYSRAANLNALGERFGLGEKSADLGALAAQHGGYDKIPIDDEKYRTYLDTDVRLNHRIYHHLRALIPDETYLMREHQVAALAAQFSMNGFRVDLELLEQRFREGEERRQKAIDLLHEHFGLPVEDEKGKRHKSPLATKAGKAWLVEALQSRGVTNWWTTGKTNDIATGREAMQQLALQHMDNRDVRIICKLVIAIVTTRTVYGTIQDHLVGDRVHATVSMHQSTGRWSSSKPGLTVMGKRGGKWREREVFAAEPGHVIIACDLAQIDMRAIAGLSQDTAYINMLMTEDPHSEIAQMLFGDRSKREIAKPIGHGWNYGRGIRAISEDNDIAPELVMQFDRESRQRFPRLVQWQDEVREIAASGELLDNGFGRPMRPDPSRAHTQGPALMGQGAARDLMMTALLRLPEECWPMLRAQVHDEVVLSVPKADAVDVQRAVLEAMTFEWRGVPIKGDGGPTDRTNWGQCYAK